MEKPVVSIITPLFNSANYVEETIKSVLQQTFKNWEWIIINDCSTDNSLEIVQKYAVNEPRIRVFQNTENAGPAISRNKGIEAAKGKYIAFIDSDDLWFPNFIDESIKKSESSGSGFVFSSLERWNEDFTVKFDNAKVPDTIDYKQLLYTCPIICSTVFINIEKYGKLYMPNFPKRQDYGLWLEYLKIIPFAVGIKEPLGKYRIRKSSISGNKRKVIKHQFNIYYKHQKLGVFRSLYYLATWAFHGFMKYRKIKR